MKLELPFPDRLLSPNCPERHWSKKNDARIAAREWAFGVTRNCTEQIGLGELLHAWITFYPPDNRRRDLDNLLAAMKSSIDGVCLGLGIDDRQIRRVTLDWGEVVEGGKVVMRLERLGTQLVIAESDPLYGTVKRAMEKRV